MEFQFHSVFWQAPCNWKHCMAQSRYWAYRTVYKDVLNGVFEQTELTDSVLYCTDKCCTDELHQADINKLCNQLIDNCLVAGDQCFPKVRPERKTKAGWNSETRDLRMDSLFWHSVWVSCGRPPTGALASVMRHTRAKYHRAVKCLKQNASRQRRIKLAESINTNKTRDLWTELKKMNKINSKTVNS